MGGKVFKFIKKHKIFSTLFLIFLLFVLSVVFVPLPQPLFKQDFSTVVLDKDKKILRVFLNSNEQWIFPPDKNFKIPKKLEKAVLIAEDKNFYSHFGVDFIAIFRAAIQNIKAKRVVSGASTITMQVARLIKQKRRTFINKLLETFQALKIETKYSKKQILSFYLNYAPFGGNIIGIQAASYKYYGKPIEKLTWSEACTLAVLPNAPGIISPDMNKKRLFEKKNKLLFKLYKNKVITKWDYELAIKEDVPKGSKKFDIVAPHFARKVKNLKEGEQVVSTIDKELQKMCKSIVKVHSNYLRGNGINNLSVLVSETKSGKVRVYLGSTNFFDNKYSGQVDGVSAKRSTGSVLKPFLYSYAIDNGVLLPQTLIKDIPTFYGAYTPTNANKKFDGLVTMEQALIRSLNVPAARTLTKIGIENFYFLLKKGGMTTLYRQPYDYGLPLVLGGAESSLWDLVTLYRGLGNYGTFSKLSYLESESGEKQGVKLLSDGSCFLILNILKKLKRPGAEYYWQMYQNSKPVAWKTGTSYGQRDALAIGVTKDWTIAVWTGNFSGEGNKLLTGASCSAPILFDIVNSLPSSSGWFKKPLSKMKKLKICKETGFLATENCLKTVEVDVPYSMKPLSPCPYHKKITVTKDGRFQVCSLCWERGNYKTVSVLCYPPSVNRVLRKRGRATYSLPSHKKCCPGVHKEKVIEITYPLNNSKIYIPTDIGGERQKITCRVSHSNATSTIYWYLDNNFLGTTSKEHSKSIFITKGMHKLFVIDNKGNEHEVKFLVK